DGRGAQVRSKGVEMATGRGSLFCARARPNGIAWSSARVTKRTQLSRNACKPLPPRRLQRALRRNCRRRRSLGAAGEWSEQSQSRLDQADQTKPIRAKRTQSKPSENI